MINLMTKPMMRTAKSFQYPLGCLEDECTYKVTWTQIDNDIEVTVSGIVQDESDWIGVGFSENNVMPQTDIIVGFFDSEGKAVIKDYYAVGYSPPQEDESQDIKESTLARKDGLTTMTFKRSISTTDEVMFLIYDLHSCSNFCFNVYYRMM